MPTIEEQAKEAQNILTKLYQDIEELQIKKANLSSELNSRLELAQAQSEKIHNDRMDKLESEYSKKLSIVENKGIELDGERESINKRDSVISDKEKSIDSRSKLLDDSISKFEEQKKIDLDFIDGEKKSIEKDRRLIEQDRNKFVSDFQELSTSIKDYNNKVASFKEAEKSIDSKNKVLLELMSKNESILKQIEESRISLGVEKANLNDQIDSIQKHRKELIRLSSIKDDVVKVEEEKAEVSCEKVRVKTWADNTERREKNVIEREITASEKERYLGLREREIDNKILILKKLRETNV